MMKQDETACKKLRTGLLALLLGAFGRYERGETGIATNGAFLRNVT